MDVNNSQNLPLHSEQSQLPDSHPALKASCGRFKALKSSTQVTEKITKDTKRVNVKKITTVTTSRHAGEKEVKKHTRTIVTTTNTQAVTLLENSPNTSRCQTLPSQKFAGLPFSDKENTQGHARPHEATIRPKSVLPNQQQLDNQLNIVSKLEKDTEKPQFSTNVNDAFPAKKVTSGRKPRWTHNKTPSHHTNKTFKETAVFCRNKRDIFEQTQKNATRTSSTSSGNLSLSSTSKTLMLSSLESMNNPSAAVSVPFKRQRNTSMIKEGAMNKTAERDNPRRAPKYATGIFFVTGIENVNRELLDKQKAQENTSECIEKHVNNLYTRPLLDCGKIWTLPCKEKVFRGRKRIITCYKDYLD